MLLELPYYLSLSICDDYLLVKDKINLNTSGGNKYVEFIQIKNITNEEVKIINNTNWYLRRFSNSRKYFFFYDNLKNYEKNKKLHIF